MVAEIPGRLESLLYFYGAAFFLSTAPLWLLTVARRGYGRRLKKHVKERCGGWQSVEDMGLIA
jgi:hypothetical protein